MVIRLLLVAVACLGAGCTGFIGDAPTSAKTDATTGDGSPTAAWVVAVSGARRLTRAEYKNTIEDLLGPEVSPDTTLLPSDYSDPENPFDTNYANDLASPTLIGSLQGLAESIAAAVAGSASTLRRIMPCTPVGNQDATCFQAFVRSFGRRALRRPLTDAEVTSFMGLFTYAAESSAYVTTDFNTAVRLALEAFLQHPELVYRIEVGDPLPGGTGLVRLTAFELASRMSYLLWGSTPDAQLLAAAESGTLLTSEGRRAEALRMLGMPRAVAQVDSFHAQWLGYARSPLSVDLTALMRRETSALLRDVIFDHPRSYWDVFLAEGTYVNNDLAAHYGFASPGSSNFIWQPYADGGRRGILSHGTFLSAFSKFSDTSPTQRGKAVRARLMCEGIPKPPPNANVDQPPPATGVECKKDAYAAHRAGGCANCHNNLDPVGFGLENYDQLGRYRAFDTGLPQCSIDGVGEVVGLGTFEKPAGLATLLVESGRLEDCAVQQLYRFYVGRRETRDEAPAVAALEKAFVDSGHAFAAPLIELIASDTFGFYLYQEL